METSNIKYIIRNVEILDLPALEWNGEYKHFRRLYKELFRRAENGEAFMWVAEILDIGIVGQLFMQYASNRKTIIGTLPKAYIFSVRVKPNFRNKGIGTTLISHAEKHLIEHGLQYATLNVIKSNHKAIRFYESLGYKIVRHEDGKWTYVDHKGNVQHVHEPSWRMEKQLAARSDEYTYQNHPCIPDISMLK
ncbi:MAG: GNAT family N-acetyltransferase [Anaerolineales bacterium]|nr:GNAT family N-acetyltransferase [Anaerolineales bacterium]